MLVASWGPRATPSDPAQPFPRVQLTTGAPRPPRTRARHRASGMGSVSISLLRRCACTTSARYVPRPRGAPADRSEFRLARSIGALATSVPLPRRCPQATLPEGVRPSPPPAPSSRGASGAAQPADRPGRIRNGRSNTARPCGLRPLPCCSLAQGDSSSLLSSVTSSPEAITTGCLRASKISPTSNSISPSTKRRATSWCCPTRTRAPLTGWAEPSVPRGTSSALCGLHGLRRLERQE